MAAGGTTITGDKALMRKLKMLETTVSKRAARAGVNAGLTPIVRAIKQGINDSAASKEVKRVARPTIGKRLATTQGVVTQAKVGFGVGKGGKARTKKITTAQRRREGRGRRRGVGINARNIHWLVLGTKGRVQTKTGHKTGAVRAFFEGIIARASIGAAQASLRASQTKAWQVIKRAATRKV